MAIAVRGYDKSAKGAQAFTPDPMNPVVEHTFKEGAMKAGLQHFLADARKFHIIGIRRDHLMAGNRETAKDFGIPYLTDAEDEVAREILAR